MAEELVKAVSGIKGRMEPRMDANGHEVERGCGTCQPEYQGAAFAVSEITRFIYEAESFDNWLELSATNSSSIF